MKPLQRWFPKIEQPNDARKLSKQGAIGILIFTAMNLFGVILAVYFNRNPVDSGPVDAQDAQEQIIGAAILVPLLFFFAYRLYAGKGWFVGGLVLAWFVLEIVFKILGGTTNIGWIIFYVFVIGMLVNGIRACWWLRNNPENDEPNAEADA